MSKQRYKYWNLDELYTHLEKQAIEFKVPIEIVTEAVYSKAWNPIKDFNGCNFVQDDFHPFLPCFIHDFRWLVYGRKNIYDVEFRNNLLKFGYSTLKASMFYFGVRLGSVFYKIKDLF